MDPPLRPRDRRLLDGRGVRWRVFVLTRRYNAPGPASVVLIYARGQSPAPPESTVVTLPSVEGFLLRVPQLAPALPGDGQDAVGEGDFHVLRRHPRERDPHHEVSAFGEYVGGRNPSGRVGPRPH